MLFLTTLSVLFKKQSKWKEPFNELHRLCLFSFKPSNSRNVSWHLIKETKSELSSLQSCSILFRSASLYMKRNQNLCQDQDHSQAFKSTSAGQEDMFLCRDASLGTHTLWYGKFQCWKTSVLCPTVMEGLCPHSSPQLASGSGLSTKTLRKRGQIHV